MNPNQYVEKRGDGWYVSGTRVSLDSVIYCFRDGASAEAIAYDCFPVLTLEEVYGAITFYLAHRQELDAYLLEAEAKAAEWGRQHPVPPAIAAKIAAGRKEWRERHVARAE